MGQEGALSTSSAPEQEGLERAVPLVSSGVAMERMAFSRVTAEVGLTIEFPMVSLISCA